MRILLVNDYTEEYGGTETLMVRTSALLEKAGHRTLIWGGRGGESLASYAARIYSPAYRRSFGQVVEVFQPDVVHAFNVSRVISPSFVHAIPGGTALVQSITDIHLFCPNGIDRALKLPDDSACKTGYGVACWGHCIRHPVKAIRFAKLGVHRALLARHLHRALAESALVADWVQRSLGVPTDVLYSFLGLDALPRVPSEGKDLMYVGRLQASKGPDLAIRSLKILREQGHAQHLHIVGTGDMERALRQLTEALGLEKHVTFHGFIPRDQVTYVVAKAGVILVPSRSDAGPLVLWESLAWGRPVVASDVGPSAEILAFTGHGVVVPPEDPASLAREALRMLRHPPAMPDRTRFTDDAYTEQLLCTYAMSLKAARNDAR